MNFLNLGVGELLGLAGAISAVVVALYLLDRSKRRQVVATLRFWTPSAVRAEWKRRRRIQQPWSLVLQLLSLLLLLLAMAGAHWGGAAGGGRDHVIILDTSAWMGARARGGTLLDQAKTAALAYLHSLPSTDRVMLVRADALATPVTAFESSHGAVQNAIAESQPGASALNLPQAFEFAERAQRLQAQRSGEIVFAGAGRIPQEDVALVTPPRNLRVLAVASAAENIGLRKVGLRRTPSSPDSWEAFVVVRNYGARPHKVDLELQFGGSPAGSKSFALAPGAESQATFSFHAGASGFLETRIRSDIQDVFPQDDRTVIELPAPKTLRVIAYTSEPDLLKGLIGGQAQIEALFLSPSKYDPQAKADIVILDRFAPSVPPRADSIWIEPPPAGSPFPVRSTETNARLERWRADTTLGAGLYTRDVQLASAQIFNIGTNDISVAEIKAGPVIVARASSPKIVALGFHPERSSMKYQLATPLLVANILRWMAPETFRRWDVQAGTVGTVSVPLDKGTTAANIAVTGDNQRPLPFTIDGDTLRFFAGATGTAHLLTGDRETVYSLTLPDVANAVWKVPAGVSHGVPRAAALVALGTDLWPWFALLGALGLLTDWMLFGRSLLYRRMARITPAGLAQKIPWRKAS